MTLAMAGGAGGAVPDPAAVETLLTETAAALSEPLREEGRGYSYYTYGTDELLYAVGDLDGDGRPEIAARAVYFMGVGSYDLVDVFTDRGEDYERVDFLNLYNLGLEDEVERLEVRDGVLRIGTVGIARGNEVRKCGAFRWRGPKDIERLPLSPPPDSAALRSVDDSGASDPALRPAPDPVIQARDAGEP